MMLISKRQLNRSTGHGPESRVTRMIISLLIFGAFAMAQSTQPSQSAVDGMRSAQLRLWLVQLADQDPSARAQARRALMGMNREELRAFREIVRENRPLLPSQLAVMRDIVTHVYLANERYAPAMPKGGFMGVQLAEAAADVGPVADGDALGGFRPTIVERVKGFGGYRSLENGDVVLGIEEAPRVPLRGMSALSLVIGQFSAGATVHLRVLRQGKIIIAPVTLSARPLELGEVMGNLNSFRAPRENRATEYWDKEFAGAIGEQTS